MRLGFFVVCVDDGWYTSMGWLGMEATVQVMDEIVMLFTVRLKKTLLCRILWKVEMDL